MSPAHKYELVVGLEVHVQLSTRSKLFCGDAISYGGQPNTQVSAITLAHPGTLPKMNKQAVEMAVKMGLACHCSINRHNYFARKNYFYPDLPKGYQISQHTTPVCEGGYVNVLVNDAEKTVRLNRIHLEEDAGKSIHDETSGCSNLDFNRAGTPLIEIVTEPDIRTAGEAYAYVTEIRKLVRYLDISDGNMEEGSLRCDANISIRLHGASELGTRVEIKNLNSIRNVRRAIEYEFTRLVGLLEKGETIIQQTRGFDANKGTTYTIRDKEDAEDYRYFADPDLSPFSLDEKFIEQVRGAIPLLQPERIQHYQDELGLSPYDAKLISEDRRFADYFESLISSAGNSKGEPLFTWAKACANWMLGPVKSWLNEKNVEIDSFPIPGNQLTKLIQLVQGGKVSFSIASARLFNSLLASPSGEPIEIATRENVLQKSDENFISELIDGVLEKNQAKVKEFRKGKKGLLALFVGEVMKASKGKADPRLTNELLLKKLNQ